MIPTPTDPFALPANHPKSSPELIDADRAHFGAVAAAVHTQRAEAAERLDAVRRRPAGVGGAAVERDAEVRRLSGRIRLLERFDIDLCLGRMTLLDGGHLYIGRAGLRTPAGEVLLIDWRTPAAEPYFAATLEHPVGIVSRRRYRWVGERIVDYWDEALTDSALDEPGAWDDQSAFIASLGSHREPRMRDVLATIQADQDAIIRTPSPGALVVDGGPGTGKTVVALHRAAHLLYAEPHLTSGGGGMLLIGPNENYLAYVQNVLPSLGEDSVRLSTLRDLVPQGRLAVDEADARVAGIKAALDPAAVIAAAVAEYERPPQRAIRLETPWADLWLTRDEWAELFDRADGATPHNPARDEVWEEIVEYLVDQVGDPEVPPHAVRGWLRQDDELTGLFLAAWPIVAPVAVVARLWTDIDFFLRCAPHVSAADAAALQRDDAHAWTVSDLPLLDEARRRIGGLDDLRRDRRARVDAAASQAQMSRVVEELIANDDSEMKVMSILRGQDAQNVLAEAAPRPVSTIDELAGPFAHIVVDEAQELTDAEWRMVLSRCPSRSVTVVGDRAQARHGFAETWAERLARVGVRSIRIAQLSINYRTPAEVMAVAAPVILAVLPDANVPTSVRRNGNAVREGHPSQRDHILGEWLADHPEGVACVIGDPSFVPGARVRALTPTEAKGLEFDLVVLVRPEQFGADVTGAVDRYVAMTRSTAQLVVLRD
ncbi:RNA polymerase recycling motor ATPase HelR [Microbacterium sp. RD1]|uniref:RNA polymerase recycling motor ATPase HelR n=1 Tax=Microbacterium sp. RD1 TaxID=3457313 RepID=UPI003FA5D95F